MKQNAMKQNSAPYRPPITRALLVDDLNRNGADTMLSDVAAALAQGLQYSPEAEHYIKWVIVTGGEQRRGK